MGAYDEKTRKADVAEKVMDSKSGPLSKGVMPDYTAPSIFFQGVTAHTVGIAGFSFTFEVQRSNVDLDGCQIAERVHSGVLRCANVDALHQLRHSIDVLLQAATGRAPGAAAN